MTTEIEHVTGLRGIWIATPDDAMHVAWLGPLAADAPQKFRDLPSTIIEEIRDEGGRRIAVLGIDGHLVAKPTPAARLLGMPSYAEIVERVEALCDDATIDGILLSVEKFGGGMLDGLREAAESIALATKRKPVVAYLTMAGPIGLALAAGASRIIMPTWSWAGPTIAHDITAAAELVPDGARSLLEIVAHLRRVPVDVVGVLRTRCRPGELAKLKLIDAIGGEAVALEGLLSLIRRREGTVCL